jgi:Ca2+-binding EF-hand superfamily protein
MSGNAGILPPGLGDVSGLLSKFQNVVGGGGDFAQQFDANIANELFKKIDTGGGQNGAPDQKISAAELAKALGISEDQAKQLIKSFEANNPQANKDGMLDQNELNAALQQLMKAAAGEQGEGAGKGQQAGGGEGAGGGQGAGGSQQAGGAQQGQGGQDGGQGGAQDILGTLTKLLDTNGDGKVDEKELNDFIKKYAGEDGKLSKEELETGLKDLAQQNPDKGVKIDDIDKLFQTVDTDGKNGISPYELTIAVGKGAETDASME